MILVTGASGFLGLNLVRALIDGGEHVRALVRSDAAAGAVEAVGRGRVGTIEAVTGDVLDATSLAKASTGCRLVYHLAGSYRGSDQQLRRTHVEGTRNLLRAVEGGGRLVLVSSTSVYGWERPWPADELTPPQPLTAYGEAKLAAESLVQAWTGGEGIVVRPTIVYGPGDRLGMLPRAARLLARGLRLFPGAGTNRIHLLHVADFVAGLQLIGERGRGVFVLAGPEPAPIRRILESLASAARLPSPVFGVPAAGAHAVATGLETAWRALGREAPLTRHAVDVVVRDRSFSWARAARELSWAPRVALEDSLHETAAWLTTNDPGVRRRARSLHRASARAEEDPTPVAGGVASSPGPPWQVYFDDPDEGLGTVYERFGLSDLLDRAVERTASQSVLHAPLFGMMGIPGLDCVFQARRGVHAGLLDVDPARLEAVTSLWRRLGLSPTTHLAPWPDTSAWPDLLPDRYDLVFSFAGLWWFDDPWQVLAAQARWARKGVLVVVPNRNVFMAVRSRLWHKDMFERLNEDALRFESLTAAAARAGLEPVEDGWFDLPPFPDTSVPLRQVLTQALNRRRSKNTEPNEPAADGGAWRWTILRLLEGDDPTLEERVRRLGFIERRATKGLMQRFAHHRWVLLLPRSSSGSPADPASAALTARAQAAPGVLTQENRNS